LRDTVAMPVFPDVAWAYLRDTDAVAACIPGLVPGSIEQVGDDTFHGTMRHLALGIPSVWKLQARVTRRAAERLLDVDLTGTEERLGLTLEGAARLSILGGDRSDAALAYTGDLTVKGRLAGAGGPIIERVVASIIERFVENVGGAGAVQGRWAGLVARLRALFRRPPSLDRLGGRT
jgi:carbon monoxide dehydrogenase subunit G